MPDLHFPVETGKPALTPALKYTGDLMERHQPLVQGRLLADGIGFQFSLRNFYVWRP